MGEGWEGRGKGKGKGVGMGMGMTAGRDTEYPGDADGAFRGLSLAQ